MKILLSIFLSLLLWSCSQNRGAKITSEKEIVAKDLDWLIGDWKRINDKEGRQTFEEWKKVTSMEYLGFGYTLAEKDTIFKESIRVFKHFNTWNFVVSGVNEVPTLFTFTNHTDSSFVCRNEENDFPKQIEYFNDDKKLYAKVSDDKGNKISFSFERLKH